MEPWVFNELQNQKVKLEAVRDKSVNESEAHDLLVEAVAKLETLLAPFTDTSQTKKRTLVEKFVNP